MLWKITQQLKQPTAWKHYRKSDILKKRPENLENLAAIFILVHNAKIIANNRVASDCERDWNHMRGFY